MSQLPTPLGEATVASIQKVDQIVNRIHDLFFQATDLAHETHVAIVFTERENAGIQLKAVVETLKKEIDRLRVHEALCVTDVAGVYLTAGYTRDEAIMKAKEALEGLYERVRVIENRAGKMVADLVYGV